MRLFNLLVATYILEDTETKILITTIFVIILLVIYHILGRFDK